MATYDLLMLAVLVGLTLYGYFKGMAWQIAYLASFIASYFVAVRFADRVAPQITFVQPPVNKFVAMLLIYAVCSFAVWTIFRVVSKGIDRVKMDGFDHQMGALLGFGRGVLWCVGLTFFAVTLLPATQKQQIVNSRSGYYIARLLDETDSLFPPEVHEVIGPYLARLENELAPAQSWPQQQGGAARPTNGATGWPAPNARPPAPGNAAPGRNDWGWDQPAAQPAPGWPASGESAPATTASDFGWPADTGGGGQPANTPAQPASWPDWN